MYDKQLMSRKSTVRGLLIFWDLVEFISQVQFSSKPAQVPFVFF